MMKVVLLKFIWFYQAAISGFLGQRCRVYPTCSNYATESIERFGPLKGTVMTIKRIAKCHPFSSGGVDLVPGHECEGCEGEVT